MSFRFYLILYVQLSVERSRLKLHSFAPTHQTGAGARVYVLWDHFWERWLFGGLLLVEVSLEDVHVGAVLVVRQRQRPLRYDLDVEPVFIHFQNLEIANISSLT